MQSAARRDGVSLVVVSGFRSNAEQAALFAAHPDPKWVAPPGKSLHRAGTELDLGPRSAYGWLASNLLTVPRLSMAMAQRGDFPAFFDKVHPVFRTPWVSILFFAGLSWALANQAGLLQNLSLAAVSRLFTYGLVCAALPVLRRRDKSENPAVPPPLFWAPFGNVLALIAVAVSITLATRMNLREAGTMAFTVALATLYWFSSRPKRRATD